MAVRTEPSLESVDLGIGQGSIEMGSGPYRLLDCAKKLNLVLGSWHTSPVLISTHDIGFGSLFLF